MTREPMTAPTDGPKITLVHDDLNVVIVWSTNDYSLTFDAYEQVGWESDRKPGGLAGCLFEEKGSASVEMTADLEQAQTMISGSVKWDGCSHYNFGEDGYLHLCGGYYVRQLAALTTFIYELAAANIEHWDAETAK